MGALKVYDGTAWQPASLATGVTQATSSTRPSAPYWGQAIYETDTERFYMWDGAAWLLTGVKPCYARGSQTGTQTVAHNTTDVIVRLDASDLNTHPNGTVPGQTASFVNVNGNRLSIPIDGDYMFGGSIFFGTGPTPTATNAFRRLLILRNAVYTLGSTGHGSGTVGTPLSASSPNPMSLIQGDYLQLEAYQNSGSGLDLTDTGSLNCEIWARRVG